MTTSCYLPVFYCFWLSLSTRSFFEILFKELSGLFYCSIVNVLRCCVSLTRNFLSLTHSKSFVNNFFILFLSFFKLARRFLDSHIRLSHLYDLVKNFFIFVFDLFWLFTQLLFRSRDSSFILSLLILNVNNFFIFYVSFFTLSFFYNKTRKKEQRPSRLCPFNLIYYVKFLQCSYTLLRMTFKTTTCPY